MQLLTLQRKFKDTLFKGNWTDLENELDPSQSSLENRGFVYQNNVFASLVDVLQSTFCRTHQYLGPEAFKNAATHFIHASPPSNGCLFRYGNLFPNFLEFFYKDTFQAHTDIATIEWAMNQSYYTVDTPSLSHKELAAIPQENLLDTCFKMHPSLHLIETSHKIEMIWDELENNRTDQAFHSSVIKEPSYCLVSRPAFVVQLFWIDQPLYHFINALSAGASLCKSFEKTAEHHTDFDFSQALTFCIMNGFFTEYS